MSISARNKSNIRISGITAVRCSWCGHETDNDIHHYHGAVSTVCRYGSCRSNWQNFKYRIINYKKSKFVQVKEFAYKVEQKVFEEKEPAILWNDQLVSIRRLQKHLPLLRPVIELN